VRPNRQDANWAEWRSEIDRRLAELVPAVDGGAGRLSEAARYALLAPGKRLRPLLTMAATVQFGGSPEAALDAGCAFEMVHAASLILDDLPSMDDAVVRRGRASAHRVYGEDLAVLAAVALLARAFGVLGAAEAIAPAGRLRLVGRLSEAVGFDGLSAGQTRDLHERDPGGGLPAVESLNAQKTGVLFALAAEAGALAAGASEDSAEAARRFGDRLGAAFQIRDDLLDLEGEAATIGKDVGRDGNKPTVVSLLGPEAARARAAAELQAASEGVGLGPLSELGASEHRAGLKEAGRQRGVEAERTREEASRPAERTSSSAAPPGAAPRTGRPACGRRRC
jgi:geranylgeranyl diphosphate synthase type II